MQNDNTFLGTERIGKLLFRLALPAVTAQLVNMLYNLVDRIYIGHIPETGSLALTGMGVCMPLIMLISAFAALVSMGLPTCFHPHGRRGLCLCGTHSWEQLYAAAACCGCAHPCVHHLAG